MTMTVPTPICPILTCLHHSWVFRTIPKHPLPIPNPLVPPQVSLHLNNALSNPLASPWANSCLSNTLPNPLTPLHLVNAFLTWRSFNLLSSCVKSIPDIHTQSQPNAPSLFLCQVYSWCFIGLTTAVGQSLITYRPCSICPSLSLLTLYISVLPPVHCMFLCTSSFVLCLILSSPSLSTLISFIFILSFHQPYLDILYFPYDLFLIVQINLIITTPHTCLNTLVTSCCSLVW